MHSTTIGLDIAKHVFQVHGVDASGAIFIRQKLRRSEVLASLRRSLRLWSGWKRARPAITGHASCGPSAMTFA